MMWEVYRYHTNNRIPFYYIEPNFYFTYEFSPFVAPLPGQWMYLVFFIMGISALGVSLGFFYRVSVLLFFLSYTYVFLLDKAQYNNHYYLIILIAFLLLLVDAHRWSSVDQKLRAGLHHEFIPYWHVFILRAQIVIVYVYAGIAKLNIDWLAGRPMRDWLLRRAYYPFAGPFFETEFAGLFFSYGGLLLDLTIGFLLLWRQTRLPAFLALLFFHLMNKWLFNIGIFPYLMIAAIILFVDPDWPRKILRGAQLVLPAAAPLKFRNRQAWVFGFVTLYLSLQILIPLRHWLYPSYVAWSEEGHRFSWRMKLRGKTATEFGFIVTNPQTNESWLADMRQDLTTRQISKMSTRPDMMIQYAHFLRNKLEQAGIQNPVIQAHAKVSLNGRVPQFIVDPSANLAEVPANILAAYDWLLPLPTDLSPQSYPLLDDD